MMKVGDKIKFLLFGVETEGEIYNINKTEKTLDIFAEGYKYPGVKTFSKLPKKKSDIPPWYILTNKTTKR
jgi:hypothetical protein